MSVWRVCVCVCVWIYPCSKEIRTQEPNESTGAHALYKIYINIYLYYAYMALDVFVLCFRVWSQRALGRMDRDDYFFGSVVVCFFKWVRVCSGRFDSHSICVAIDLENSDTEVVLSGIENINLTSCKSFQTFYKLNGTFCKWIKTLFEPFTNRLNPFVNDLVMVEHKFKIVKMVHNLVIAIHWWFILFETVKIICNRFTFICNKFHSISKRCCQCYI